jgi:acetyl-CoA C-acetyltransferase
MKIEIVLLDGARTPFGAFCGSLRDITATNLGVVAAKEAMRRSGVRPDQIDHVVFGNAEQTSGDAIFFPRHVGIFSGVPLETPALLVQRICGTGLQALVTAAQLLTLGEATMVLAGGAENLSQAPFVIRGARWGLPMKHHVLEDYLWEAFKDTYNDLVMGGTAEVVAERYHISREDQDKYGYMSQMRAKAAREKGYHAEEITPVGIKDRKGSPVPFAQDEHPRPDTSLEKLATLKPFFKKDGTVTAGNASGISDGGCAFVVTTREKADELGLKYVGKFVSWGIVGVDPDIMGIGPAFAIPAALKKAGMKLGDIDLIEINEAFASQVLACQREVGIDIEKLNVNGGAIALGHPLAATGARTTLTMLYELRRRKNARYGISSMCIGGGQGIAAILEKGNKS